VPKCEIFDLLDSNDFYTIKSPWVDDFGTVIKNSKLFRFRHDFEIFFRENFELGMLSLRKKIVLRARPKKNIIAVFETRLQVSKTIF
jgi:hypothetical protein